MRSSYSFSWRLCSLYVIAGVIVCSPLSAQVQADSGYIKRYPRHVTVRLYLGEKISIFNLEDKEHERTLHYRPNNILGLGAGITIRGIGLNFSTRLPFHDTKQDEYGRTRRYDLQMHRYSRMLALDVYVQRYKGFHLSNSDDVDSVVSHTTYPYFEQLRALTFGVSGMYVFNGKKFSLRAGIHQQEWQRKSAGSLMLGGALFARYIYNEGTSLLPPYYKYPEFFSGNELRHITNYSLAVKVGYGYNLVLATHYFVSATAEVGIGPSYSIVRDVAGNEQQGLGLDLTGNLRFGAGYNSDTWIAGVYVIANSDRYSLPYDRSALSTTQGIFRLAVARRIPTNRKILQSPH